MSEEQEIEEFNKHHPHPDGVGVTSLYRFYKINNKHIDRLRHIFVDRKLYHALPSQLNDPFECRPHFNWQNNPEKIQKIHNHLTKVAIERGHSKKSAKKLITQNIKKPGFIKDTISSSILRTFGEIRICSFTTKKENLLFWSHYADSHRGFCIEFDATKMPIAYAFKVHYQEDYPKVEYPRPTDARGFKPALIKSTSWEYEEEFRTIFVPVATKQPPNDGDSLILRGDEILNVYLGSNISRENRELLAEIIDSGPFSTRIWSASISGSSFSLEFNLL